MRKKLITICILLFFGTLFFKVQQSLPNTSNSDADGAKSLNKIAIAAVGDSVNSEISMIAGRAPYYLIFDGNGVFLKSIKNPSQSSGRRSSLGVVNLLLKESCQTVIAGNFGGKMQNQLKANKIEYYEHKGIVIKVVQKFIKNRSKNLNDLYPPKGVGCHVDSPLHVNTKEFI
ncbi:MAG: hypothetical protein JW875_01130 [Spirochaetales bacterium]|nr:hypothetical protein [Spirochaetales bacterium]